MTIRGGVDPETLEELFGEKPFADDADLEAELNCGRNQHGCLNAGTMYCELHCPYRDERE